MASAQSSTYEIIEPKADLKKKVKKRTGAKAAIDPVSSAEAALKRLSPSFTAWIGDEVMKLIKAWQAVLKEGMDEDRGETLFRAAHDIKGQAATFGYPLAGVVAGSLCSLFEHVPDWSKIPSALIEQHVQAMRAIVDEGARGEENEVAYSLAKELSEVSKAFIDATVPPPEASADAEAS